MNTVSFLLVCALAFLLGIILGLLSRPLKNSAEPIVFNEPSIAYEISEELNCEYRNFLSYDGTEQN